MRVRNVVVAIDFSAPSVVALRRARTLLGRGKTIHLIHVLDPMRSGERGGGARKALVSQCRKKLDDLIARELAQEAADDEGWAIERHVGVGRPAEALAAAARKADADLVVIGSHARGKLARAVLGSVAEEVARISDVPVLVVREKAEGGGPIERVLVAVDGSGPSRLAIRAGVALAAPLGAKVEAVSVLDPETLGEVPDRDDVAPKYAQAAGMLLPKAVTDLLPSHARVRYALGEPAVKLGALASDGDVIVCGTHGRSALGRLAFGSVATKLIRTAPCPVLVVRPKTPTFASARKR